MHRRHPDHARSPTVEGSRSGVGCSVTQTAQVLAHLHADVALLAPARAPGVANDPVRGGRVEADDSNT